MSHSNFSNYGFSQQQAQYNRSELSNQQQSNQLRAPQRGSLQASPTDTTPLEYSRWNAVSPRAVRSHNTSHTSFSAPSFQQAPSTTLFLYNQPAVSQRSVYAVRNEDPWNPLQLNQPNEAPHVPGPMSSRNTVDKTDLMGTLTRDNPSISGAPSLDSGYATQSMPDQSVYGAGYGDLGQERQSLIDDEHVTQALSEHASQGYSRVRSRDMQSSMQDTVSESSRTSHQRNLGPFNNENIDDVTRDNMPQKKAKKAKRYVCDAKDCPRKNEGFTSKNDLARHKKTVHKVVDPDSRDKNFRCVGDNCPKKDKIWPRLDNFRQHVNRLHKEENAEDLVKRSQISSDMASNGIFGQPRSLDMAMSSSTFVNSSFPDSPSMQGIESSHAYRKAEFSQHIPPEIKLSDLDLGFSRPNSLGVPNSTGTDHGYYNSQSSEEIISPKPRRAPSPLATTQDKNPSPPRSSSSHLANPATMAQPDIPTNVAQEFASQLQSLVQNFLAQLPLQELQRIIESNAHNLPRQGDSKKRTFDEAGLDEMSKQPGKKVSCSQCSKKMNRPCDIKKHEKRHDRPYGCTYPSCTKAFGSKNDWKRHENSQHYQQETWRCSHPDLQSKIGVCAKIFFRREIFQSHLRKDHNDQNEDEIREHCRKSRVGRNNNSGFWCGFCKNIIELQKRGLEAWDERFNHIDDQHFKKGLRTNQWYPMDKDVPKGKLSLESNLHADGLLTANSDEEAGDDESETENTNKAQWALEIAVHQHTLNPTKRQRQNKASVNSNLLQPPSYQSMRGNNVGTYQAAQKLSDENKRQGSWFCCFCGQGPHRPLIEGSCSSCLRHRCIACPMEPDQ